MKVTLHPAAETDVREAAEFYERTGSSALAAKFVAEFKRVSQMLLEFPGMGSNGRQSNLQQKEVDRPDLLECGRIACEWSFL